MQLYQLHCLNGEHYDTEDHTNSLTNPYIAIMNDEHCCAWPIELGITKFLVFKAHFCSLPADLYLVKGNNNCALALYVDTD